MISFQAFLAEAEVDHIAHLLNGRSVGFLSASRGHLPQAVNDRRTALLAADLKKSGHHFVPATGGYTEGIGTPKAKDVHEKSFMVFHDTPGDDKGAVLSTIKKLGQKYNQDSVMHKAHNSKVAMLHGTSVTAWPGLNKVSPAGKYVPEKREHFTQIGKKVFSFA